MSYLCFQFQSGLWRHNFLSRSPALSLVLPASRSLRVKQSVVSASACRKRKPGKGENGANEHSPRGGITTQKEILNHGSEERKRRETTSKKTSRAERNSRDHGFTFVGFPGTSVSVLVGWTCLRAAADR